mmetsp:Transcript_30847/g.60207  ORF Transcript_30847/g.60207 Transcript_30847/m.60207 type:complete len:390 (+) Transcript_30847:1-1170(+)|eukprot:CAMPEP_0175155754 /NCGR_PEP_ID=MMETSP0087-20121206/21181_1 /TAXON_ID=136419 /ORGANISM="Unknown Unknown, Strain D1" /LENGTH=389 /DNA_ID=CAMNT_0016443005 /DNA_START=1 /DNA_END=1173 /DNA_ORIENTATION=-
MVFTFAMRRMPRATSRLFSTFSGVAPHIISNNVWNSVCPAVGNTSLIKLRKASELTGCNIYGKAEFENPGGSIKDRAALFIVKEAEERGLLSPGNGVIVEGTAGNTGIGLAMIANSRGYDTIILIPASQSQEKKMVLRNLGATLIEIPAVPYKNPNNYVHVAERLANSLHQKLGNVLLANQWNNLANQRAHEATTGPEIWQQLDGKVDAFSCAVGTGGTITGVAQFLRSKSKDIKIGLTDPRGAALYRYFRDGELAAEGDSITEGIGQGRITGNLEGFRPDLLYEITDEEALNQCYSLISEEGLNVGLSAGVNVAGAVKVAQELGPGHNIVTVLCDRSDRYVSKMFNTEFLSSRNLPTPPWLNANDRMTALTTHVGESLTEALSESPSK